MHWVKRRHLQLLKFTKIWMTLTFISKVTEKILENCPLKSKICVDKFALVLIPNIRYWKYYSSNKEWRCAVQKNAMNSLGKFEYFNKYGNYSLNFTQTLVKIDPFCAAWRHKYVAVTSVLYGFVICKSKCSSILISLSYGKIEYRIIMSFPLQRKIYKPSGRSYLIGDFGWFSIR